MAERFKFRYVNELSGVFIIISVALMVFFFFLTAHVQRWFEGYYEINVLLPEEGSYGLRHGAEVQFMGTNGGEVKKITFNEGGRMEAELRIRPDFFQFMRDDSVAVIRSSIGLGTNVYLEITRGKGMPLPKKNAVISCRVEEDIFALMREKLHQFEEATLPTFREYGKLASDLRDPEGSLSLLLSRMNSFARKLEEGDSLVAKLLTDKSLGEAPEKILTGVNTVLSDMQTLLKNTKETSSRISELTVNIGLQLESMPRIASQTEEVLKRVGVVLEDMHGTMDKFPDILRTIEGELEAMPGLIIQTKETLLEVERLVEAMQKHWLLRGYVDQPGSRTRIPPSEFSPQREGP